MIVIYYHNMKLIWFASFIAFAAARWPALTVPESELSGKVNLKAINDVPASFDCAMRKLAYSFGQQALPRFGNFESLFYALGLNDDCNVSVPEFDTVALPVFKTDISSAFLASCSLPPSLLAPLSALLTAYLPRAHQNDRNQLFRGLQLWPRWQ